MSTSKNHSPLHILLAVDGSEYTRAATQLLCHLPLPPGSQVTAAGILPRRQKPEPEALSIPLIETEAILKEHRLTVRHAWLYGQPAKALTDFARTQQANLIVIGAAGLRAAFGFLLGGPAQQVVELADRPVLIVRPPYREVRRVLFVSGDSQPSQHAATYLARFPLPASAEIRALHVLPPPCAAVSYPFAYAAVSEGLSPPLITTETAEAMAQEIAYKECQGRDSLKQAVETLRAAGKEPARILVRGDTTTEVIAYAQTQAVDLIVVGSRGLGRLKSWLKGCVSRQLIHYAACSVLVVKG